MFLGKSVCILAKVVVLWQRWFSSGKVFDSGKSGCIRAKVLEFGQHGCMRAKKFLCSVKVVVFELKDVVFGQGGLNRAKWLYSGKSGSMRAKVVIFGKSDYIRVR